MFLARQDTSRVLQLAYALVDSSSLGEVKVAHERMVES